MSDPSELPETVSFRRRKELPGVEIRTVSNTRRTWRCYSTDFEFMAPRSWCGEISYRGREYSVEPGVVFCSQPTEVFAARRVFRHGSLRAVSIDPKVLQHYAAQHDLSPARLELTARVRMSENVRSKLFNLFDVVVPESSRLQLETAFLEFVDVMLRELIDHGSPPAPARMTVDLATLAGETRLSRFQALRAFKQRFGLPPNNYQLRVRLALAKQALRDGLTPAQVAADFGFVDQSHLTRHFKRFTGITPAQYARVGSERANRAASSL
jgi:AraC-like DNA-binding protein